MGLEGPVMAAMSGRRTRMGGGGRSKGLTVSGGCFNELISKLWRIKGGWKKKMRAYVLELP